MSWGIHAIQGDSQDLTQVNDKTEISLGICRYYSLRCPRLIIYLNVDLHEDSYQVDSWSLPKLSTDIKHKSEI